MKQLREGLQQMKNVHTLSREEMKNVLGGVLPPGGDTTSCSCTLKSSGGVKLTIPSDITDTWTTSNDCQSNCQTYCNGANSSPGGDCANFDWLFTDIPQN